jgi:hypothetical protein
MYENMLTATGRSHLKLIDGTYIAGTMYRYIIKLHKTDKQFVVCICAAGTLMTTFLNGKSATIGFPYLLYAALD